MIEDNFQEAFTQEWINNNIQNPENELVILRKVIPWDKISKRLAQFYSKKGRKGKSLRIMIALVILQRLRLLGDCKVVKEVKENRYIQYFCNISDDELFTFIDPSTISDFRARIGVKGSQIIETEIFKKLRNSGLIDNNSLLMDSTVLNSNIIYPNDVQLVFKAFKKMKDIAKNYKVSLWWDDKKLRKLWKGFGLEKKNPILKYLEEFQTLFIPALMEFKKKFWDKLELRKTIRLLCLLLEQTKLKLSGEKHIENRIVSLDDTESRPIKKGKRHPQCEFGYTNQMTFNREGFMITTETFIGNPDDSRLYPKTIELFKKKDEVLSRVDNYR